MICAAPDKHGFTLGPVGTPDGAGTICSPLTVKAALELGGNVILLPGRYRGDNSMIRISGESNFSIQGEDVWIDGEFLRTPLFIKDCEDFSLSGVNVFNAIHAPFGVQRCTRSEVYRVGAWNDPVPDRDARTNDMVLGIAECQGVTLDGCFGFGFGRKTIQVYQSIRTHIKGGWYRWDDWHPSGNRMAIAPSYNSYDTLVENCMATVAGSWDPTASPAEDRAGSVHLIANDAYDTVAGVWEKLNDPERARGDTRWLVRGCTLYQPGNTRRVATVGIRVTDQVGVEITDTNILLAAHPETMLTIATNTKGAGAPGAEAGAGGLLRRVNLGLGQRLSLRGEWDQEMVGLGAQPLAPISPELKLRVEAATRISHWQEVEWPG